jgi:LEA14-like dessication related protein
MNKATIIFVYLVLFLIISGCAQLKQKVETLKPTAEIVDTRLTGISFDKADLVFVMTIDNPNPFALKLSGLVYDVAIEGQSLLSGAIDRGLSLKANGKSNVKIPVTLKFDDLEKLPANLRDKDKITYQLKSTIKVNLPVIGNYDIHLVKRDEIPVPKLPAITLKDLKIRNLSFTTAELVTILEIKNPNAFSLALNDFRYKLDINNQLWGEGKITQKQNVPGRGTGMIAIPVKLNLLRMGSGIYQLLNSKEILDYRIRGNLKIGAGIALLKNYNMPLDIKGKVSLE